MKTTYLENQEKQVFFELKKEEASVRLRRGPIGKPCLVFEIPLNPEKVDPVYERLQKEKLERGYVVKEEVPQIIEGSKAGILRTKEIEDHEVYGAFMKLPNAEFFFGDKSYPIVHFANGLDYDGDLFLTRVLDIGNIAGVIIEGDVKISGVLHYFPTLALILGDVRAKSLVKSDSHVVIKGDVHVEQTVFGYYNDGSLDISGDVSGEAWISSDHDMSALGKYRLFRQDVFNDGIPDWLNPKLVGFDDVFDTDMTADYIIEGKSVLKKGVVYNPNTIEEDEIEEEEIEANELEDEAANEEESYDEALMKKIRAFASANDNMGMTLTLVNWPKRTSFWSELCNWRLMAPSSSQVEKDMVITALEQYNEDILSPPKEIVAPDDFVEQIAEFEWKYPESGQVSEHYAVHPEVKKLIDSFSNTNAINEAFENLPERKILEAHSGWLYFKAIEKLPLTEGEMVLQKLLALDLEPYVALQSDDEFGGTNPVEFAREEGYTEALSYFYEKHPEIKAQHDREDAEAEKMKAMNTSAKREDRQEVKKLESVERKNKLANEMQEIEPANALSAYNVVLGICKPYIDTNSEHIEAWTHNHLYALQGRLWCLNEMIENGQKKLQNEAEETARQILALDVDAFYYSATGDLARHATILANNTLAWYGLENGEKLRAENKDATAVFETALAHSEEALEELSYTSDDQTMGVVLETKTRLLFALERDEEAYLIVFRVIKKLPDYTYFSDISKTKAYQKWDAEN